MKKSLFVIIIQIPIFAFGQIPSNDKNWHSIPILNEDFIGTRSWNDYRYDNTNIWKAFFSESGVIHDSTGVNCDHHYEHQIYQRENAIFSTASPGYMILRAQYMPNTTAYWYPGPPYTPVTCPYDYISGAIQTNQEFKYGYFEMKCALPPPNYGNFPAFWLWSGTNRYSEIDIFEHVINNPTDYKRVFGTYYTSTRKGIQCANYYLTSDESPLTSMHTYAIEWSPKLIIWYFDGKQIGAAINETEITNEPMQLKVNYALNNYIAQANNNLFPLEMKIDYIRVYQLDCNCGDIISITSSNQLDQYTHSVKKRITIENTVNTIIVGEQGVSLRATDEISINGNFEVPIGSEFYAMTHNCPQ